MFDLEEKLNDAIARFGLNGVHPVANLMPFTSEEEYKETLEDVRKKGFLHPVKVTEDLLLIDGRTRLCISVDIGLDVPIEKYKPANPDNADMEYLEYVISEHKRRNLTTSQKAMFGLKVEEFLAQKAREKQKQTIPQKGEKGFQKVEANVVLNSGQHRAVCQAAKLVGVGHDSISKAKRIAKEAPDLVQPIEQGKLTLNAAANEVKTRQAVQPVVTDTESRIITFNVTNDNIEWAYWTWNPVVGCKHDCPYCYARDISVRFYGNFNPTFHPDRLSAPYDTKIPKGKEDIPGIENVFVCSIADLFGEWVPADWIKQVLKAVSDNPQWNFLFLTKNPKRYKEFANDFGANCWIGATADIQRRMDAAVEVFNSLETKAAVKFVSCEPLEEAVRIPDNAHIDWLIIGGRSKSSGMPASQPEWRWVEDLLNDARQIKAMVYFKPNLQSRPKEYP